MEVGPAMRYWAFISHSSADKREARRLHRWIESYGIPIQLHERPTPAGVPAPRRFSPVFLDRPDLAAANSLRGALAESLRDSRYLIVLCSPAAARSAYVEWELQEFLRLGRRDRILALVLEGEPNSGDARECFPPSLRAPEDPLAADLRAHADGRRLARLKLLAGMLGVQADEIIRRDDERRRRRQIVFASVVAVISLVVLGLAAYGYAERTRRKMAELEVLRRAAAATAAVARERTAQAEREAALAARAAAESSAEAASARAAEAEARETAARDRELAAAARADQELARNELLAQQARVAAERAERAAAREAEANRSRYLREYVADIQDAAAAWERGEIDVMKEHMAKHAAPADHDPRGFEWYYLSRLRAGRQSGVLSLDGSGPQPVHVPAHTGGYYTETGGPPLARWHSLSFNSTGTLLAATTNQGKLVVWDCVLEVQVYSADRQFLSAAFASHPDHLVLHRRDSSGDSLELFDLASRRTLLREPFGAGSGRAFVSVSGDGKVAATCWDFTIRLWSLPDGKELPPLKVLVGERQRNTRFMSGDITSVVLNGDGTRALVGWQLGQTELDWGRTVTENGQAAMFWKDQNGPVTGLAFARDEAIIASHSLGYFEQRAGAFLAGTVQTHELNSGKTLMSVSPDLWRLSREAAPYGLGPETPLGLFHPVFSADGRLLYTCGPRSVLVWDAWTGARVSELSGHASLVSALALRPDGRVLAAGGADQTVRMWRLDEEEKTPGLLASVESGVGALALDPDGRTLYALQEKTAWSPAGPVRDPWEEYIVIAWPLSGESSPKDPAAMADDPTATALLASTQRGFAPSVGETSASGGEDGTVTIRDARHGVRRFPTHKGPVSAVALSPDGRLVATGGLDRRIFIREVEGGELIALLRGHTREVVTLCFTEDGSRLASGSGIPSAGGSAGGEVIVWHVETGSALLRLGDTQPAAYRGLAFSPDGTSLYGSVTPIGQGVMPSRISRWPSQ